LPAGVFTFCNDEQMTQSSPSNTCDSSKAGQTGGVPPSERSEQLLRLLTTSTVVLATLGLVFALRLAQPLMVPLLVGTLLSYALEPPVATLAGWGVPRSIGACIVLTAMIAAGAMGGYLVRHQVISLMARLPGAAQELRETIQARTANMPSPVKQIERAADELHEMSAGGPPPATKNVSKVEIVEKPFSLSDYLWSSTTSVFGAVADIVIVLFLALYLLIAGDLFRHRLVEIAGPTLTEKKITLQILHDISRQISRFLFVRTLISAIVALATGLALWWVGLAQPAAWGLVAGILNIIPYVGPLAVTIAVGVSAFLQFHTATMAGAAAGLTVLVACIEAYVITPWLTSRAAEMNAAAVFIGLAFFGWLWGLPGILLAVPIMMVFKAVAEHVETLHSVFAFLKS